MPTEMLQILDKSTAEQISLLFLKKFYSTVTSADFETDHQSFYTKNAEFTLKSSKGDEKKADSRGIASVYAEQGFNKAFFDLSKSNIKVIPGVGNSLFVTVTNGTIKRGNEKDEEIQNSFSHSYLLLPQKVDKSVAFYIVTEHMDLGPEKIIKKAEPKVESPKKEAKPAPKKTVEKKTEEPTQAEAAAPAKPFSYASALAKSSSPKQTPVAPPTIPSKKIAAKPVETKPQFHSQVDENSICVKKLPEGTTEETLKEVFSKHGEVKSVVVKRDLAFVEFDSKEPVSKLLSLDPKERVEVVTVNGTEHRVELWQKESRPRAAPKGTFKPKH